MNANLSPAEAISFEGTPVVEVTGEVMTAISQDLAELANRALERLEKPEIQNAPVETKLQILITELRENADTIALGILVACLGLTTSEFNSLPPGTWDAEFFRGVAMFLGGATVTQFAHVFRRMRKHSQPNQI